MTSFLDAFPRISYNISGERYADIQNVTNIFFRIGIIRNIISNVGAYEYYTIRDSDTPEILAEKVYGDPNVYWIITYANDIYDAQFDWPLNYDAFGKYIENKYGSVASAQTTPHHYEKVVQRIENTTGIVSEIRTVVDKAKLTDNDMDVPYDYYDHLPEDQEIETFNLNGKTVTQITSREVIYCYDYEDKLNEAKREIKIIKPMYYGQIMREFNNLTKYSTSPNIRKLV